MRPFPRWSDRTCRTGRPATRRRRGLAGAACMGSACGCCARGSPASTWAPSSAARGPSTASSPPGPPGAPAPPPAPTPPRRLPSGSAIHSTSIVPQLFPWMPGSEQSWHLRLTAAPPALLPADSGKPSLVAGTPARTPAGSTINAPFEYRYRVPVQAERLVRLFCLLDELRWRRAAATAGHSS